MRALCSDDVAGIARELALEQLQTVEQQLLRSQSADIINELVSAKIQAADKDYLALELKVRLDMHESTLLWSLRHSLKWLEACPD